MWNFRGLNFGPIPRRPGIPETATHRSTVRAYVGGIWSPTKTISPAHLDPGRLAGLGQSDRISFRAGKIGAEKAHPVAQAVGTGSAQIALGVHAGRSAASRPPPRRKVGCPHPDGRECVHDRRPTRRSTPQETIGQRPPYGRPSVGHIAPRKPESRRQARSHRRTRHGVNAAKNNPQESRTCNFAALGAHACSRSVSS